MTLKVKKLKPWSVLPKRNKDRDAGLDLYSQERVTLEPGKRYTFSLGIAIQLPPDTVGLVQSRSGLSNNHGLTTIGNVIDEGYTGEIHVILQNNGQEVVEINPSDRIAQLLVLPIHLPCVEEVELIESSSGRGEAGLGSSGTF